MSYEAPPRAVRDDDAQSSTGPDVPGTAPELPRRKWFGMFLFALACAAICGMLGLWQLGVAKDRGAKEAIEEAVNAPRQELTQVIQPNTPFAAGNTNRKVTVHGTWEPQRSVLVINRQLQGRSGYWVVTPVRVDGSGARLAVLRGFVPENAPRDAAGTAQAIAKHGSGASGTVTIEGTLGPGESPTQGDPLPTGQVRSTDLGSLVNEWDGAIYDAMLFESGESPAPPAKAGEGETAYIARVPAPEVPTGVQLHWQNASYVVQWWVFGAFCLFMWWKMVREERGRLLEAAAETHDEEETNRP